MLDTGIPKRDGGNKRANKTKKQCEMHFFKPKCTYEHKQQLHTKSRRHHQNSALKLKHIVHQAEGCISLLLFLHVLRNTLCRIVGSWSELNYYQRELRYQTVATSSSLRGLRRRRSQPAPEEANHEKNGKYKHNVTYSTFSAIGISCRYCVAVSPTHPVNFPIGWKSQCSNETHHFR